MSQFTFSHDFSMMCTLLNELFNDISRFYSNADDISFLVYLSIEWFTMCETLKYLSVRVLLKTILSPK